MRILFPASEIDVPPSVYTMGHLICYAPMLKNSVFSLQPFLVAQGKRDVVVPSRRQRIHY